MSGSLPTLLDLLLPPVFLDFFWSSPSEFDKGGVFN